MLKKLYIFVLFSMFLTLFVGCGDDDHFVIEGLFEGEAPPSVRAVFFAEGVLHNSPVSVHEGKFHIEGRSRHAAMVDIYLPDRSRIATVVAKNGETIDLELNRANRYVFNARGNETVKALSEWVKANADVLSTTDALKINNIVADYIRANPDRLLSTVLLLSYYDSSIDPVTAASLFDGIDAAARPSTLVEGYSEMLGRMKMGVQQVIADTIRYYVGRDSSRVFVPSRQPYALIAVTSFNLGRDSIVGELRNLAANKRIKVVELSIDTDSSMWRRSIVPDSAAWTQGWLPGGMMTPGVDQLTIPRLPYFVMIDSVGNQLIRTSSVAIMRDSVANRLK